MADRNVRVALIVFIVGLIVSGLTAFPLQSELILLHRLSISLNMPDDFVYWVYTILEGVRVTNAHYPFIAYGTDWLAFAHLILAVLFIGPLKDPVRNIWVIEFGMIACISIFPLALIAGEMRGIPLYWRLIDCSFGVVGGALLLYCYRRIRAMVMRVT